MLIHGQVGFVIPHCAESEVMVFTNNKFRVSPFGLHDLKITRSLWLGVQEECG